MRGVDGQSAVDLQVVDDAVPEVDRREVQVEGEQLAAGDVAGLAASVLQMAADEAADVLDPVLLLLRHLHVFGMGLGGLLGAGQLIQQHGPAHGLVFPGGLVATLAQGDQQIPVVPYREQRGADLFGCVGHDLSTSAFCFNLLATPSAASNSFCFFLKAASAVLCCVFSFLRASCSSWSRSR